MSSTKLEPKARQKSASPLLAGLLVTAAVSACSNPPAVLTQLMEARRLASELHVEFTKASEASHRAVMAGTPDASAAAAKEARTARHIAERDARALRELLQSLRYNEDLACLESFQSCLKEHTRLDEEILPLAAESTNIRAQRLSFGSGREAADAFRGSLDAAVRAAPASNTAAAGALAARALAAVLDMRVLQAPHIAESDDAAMEGLEKQMAAHAVDARRALGTLATTLPRSARPHLVAASDALERFMRVNDEIVTLSRRNTNVRSLALSLGRKRFLTAQCEEDLQALEGALSKHAFTATR